MADKLAGQHAFVTGGGSGIGLACARAFLADGARVSIMGRSRDKLERAAESLAALGAVDVYPADVGQEADVRAAIAAANAAAPLTIAVANAGTGDIASSVRFLCGPESSWITGAVLSVDGGQHLRRGPDYGPFVQAMAERRGGQSTE